ncbi:hypothetical protein GCM10027347_62060 [Larkinella harenae]
MYQPIKTLVELKNCNPEDGLALVEIWHLFSGKWRMLILGALYEEALRFTQIKHLIPSITPRMLSRELKELELNGLVKRTVEPTSPVIIRYGLTESAHQLSQKVVELMAWGMAHRKEAIRP